MPASCPIRARWLAYWLAFWAFDTAVYLRFRQVTERLGDLTLALIAAVQVDQRQREIAQTLSDLAEAKIGRRAKHPKGQAARRASDVTGTRQAECVMTRMARMLAYGF